MKKLMEQFRFNNHYNIFFPRESSEETFRYSDGQFSEDYIYHSIKNARDRSSFSTELALKIRDWPSLYHLSPQRANLIRALDFEKPQNMKVLELGAGCGAITRYLGEKYGEVHAIEGSPKRATIARERCSDLENVKIFCANFLDIELESQYDLATLIGVLEYAPIYHPNESLSREEKILDVLRRTLNALNDNGQLILAIENKLGLKYWSGSHEDHTNTFFEGIVGYPRENTPITFSRKELEKLIRLAGFKNIQTISVYPDYKLPTTFINANSGNYSNLNLYHWIETPFADRAGQSANLFHEALALRELDRAGLLGEFANSFLVVSSKKRRTKEISWVAKHIGAARHPAFSIETSMNRKSMQEVQKKKLFNNLFLPNELIRQTLENKPFIKGELWVYELYEAMARNDIANELTQKLKILNSLALTRFSKRKTDEDGFQILDGKAFDFVFWNIIRKDDNYYFIDNEWEYLKTFSIDFLLFRNLYHFYIRQAPLLRNIGKADDFVEKMIRAIYPKFGTARMVKIKKKEKEVTEFILSGTIKEDNSIIKISRKRDDAVYFVSIIIPVFNQCDLTRQCLESIEKATPGENYEIVVVDNGSTDGTPAYLQSLKGKIRVIRNSENLGFARACNQGAKAAKGDVLVFLNNDTMPKEGWLSALLETINRENIGIVGSKLIFPDGTVQHAGVVFTDNHLPYHIYEGLPADLDFLNREEEYSAVTGACLAIRKELFSQVNGFDESYLNGLEDIDLCLKVKKLGKKIIYQPKSVVIHFASRTQGRQNAMPQNRQIFLQKWREFVRRDDFHYYLRNGYLPKFEKGDSKVEWLPIERPLFSIVIVTHNSEESLEKNLRSIYEYSTTPYEVILVDNASQKDLRPFVEKWKVHLPLTLIQNSENRGFSAAVNQGIQQSAGDYVVLLNPDTAVTYEWLLRMLRHFDDTTGAVGPVSNYAAGLQNYTAYVNPKWEGNFSLEKLSALLYERNRGQSVETKLLIGFCMMIRREAIEKVGLLDEDLFLGNDDLDYSLRLREAGYILKVAPDVFIFHEGQHSFKKLKSEEKQRLMQESLDKFYAKLEAKYGEGNVPSSTELWGIDILGTPSKMKNIAHPTPLLTANKNLAGFKNKRVALIYDNHVRPDTTGEYVKRALQSLCNVEHILPSEIQKLEAKPFDMYLFVDDGLDYPIPFQYRPNAWWVIDTHLQYEKDLEKARLFDVVFAAQRDGAEKLKRDGIENVFWLPLAADPAIHKKLNRPKKYDVAFVGHFAPGPRNEFIQAIQENFDRVFVGQKYFKEMAEVYSESRIIFNRSLRNDVNMRVFEAVATGSLLVTNDLAENGQNELFTPGEHLVVYRDKSDLLEKLRTYLARSEKRKAIARKGRAHVLALHTYKNRMAALLEKVEEMEKIPALSIPQKKTSIVVLTFNGLAHTKKCIQSIRENTRAPYELIVVDNGSTDGTREYLKSLKDVKLILNEENRGFAAGNNQGIQASTGEYIVLLNNDTVVTKGWLCRLIRAVELAPNVGMAGPRSNYVQNPLQLVENVPYRNLEEMEKFAEDFSQKNNRRYLLSSKLVGFCLLIKRPVIEKIGLLDESFGLGNFEDDDFCLRARQSGYFLIIAGDAFIHHEGNSAFKENKISYEKMMQKNLMKFKTKWEDDLEFRGESYYLKSDLHHFAEEEIAAGEAAFSARKLKEARAHFEKALEWEPQNARAWNDLGVVFWQSGDPKQASNHFERAIELKPDDSDAWENLLGVSRENGIATQIVEWAEILPLVPGHAKWLYFLGKQLVEAGKLTEAEKLFQKAKTHKPDLPEADIGMALVAWERGEYNVALDTMEAVSRRAPENRELVLHYALMAFQIGQREEAVSLLSQYVQEHPDEELQKTLMVLKETEERIRQDEFNPAEV